MSSIKTALSVPKKKAGSQLLKQKAAKTAGLTFPREAFCCLWEALGYRGEEQVAGHGRKTTGFRQPSPSGGEKRAGCRDG